MTTKYRGSTEYSLAYQELVTAARYRGLTTYQELATIMDLPLRGSHMAAEVGRLLGEISEEELANGRPVVSTICVGANGRPGSGFFGLARQLGRLAEEGETAELAFWEAERSAVYDAWARKYQAT